MVVIGDETFNQKSHKNDGQGPQSDGQSHPSGRIAPAALAKSPAHAQDHGLKIAAEIGDHRNDAAQLDHGRESYAGIAPPQKHWHHLEQRWYF